MERYINELRGMLSPRRLEHSLHTAEEAAGLAGRYGADEDKAYLAGILHDSCKEMPLAEQLALADRLGMDIDKITRSSNKLMHAPLGAEYARQIFGVADDDIYDAIYYHTTAKADMPLLTKVIYIADYIEPTRKPYEGMERLRSLAYENLDEAIVLGIDIVIGFLIKDGMLIHHRTVEARNFIISKGGLG